MDGWKTRSCMDMWFATHKRRSDYTIIICLLNFHYWSKRSLWLQERSRLHHVHVMTRHTEPIPLTHNTTPPLMAKHTLYLFHCECGECILFLWQFFVFFSCCLQMQMLQKEQLQCCNPVFTPAAVKCFGHSISRREGSWVTQQNAQISSCLQIVGPVARRRISPLLK